MTRPGVYVDLATNHPVVISNTFFLDRCLGWKGLCIEPNPVHHSRIRQARSCSLVDKVMTGPFSPHTVTMTSTVGGRDELGGRTHVGSPTPKDRSRYPHVTYCGRCRCSREPWNYPYAHWEKSPRLSGPGSDVTTFSRLRAHLTPSHPLKRLCPLP